MKIIMPIAGIGTRLRPHTHMIPKSLIRVAGKPIIGYIIEQIESVNFSEMIFIIGYLGDQIKSYLRTTYHFPMKFIRQMEYIGLGHAIDQAKNEFPEDEAVLIVLGDIIFTADIRRIVASPENMIGIMEPEEPRKYGIVTVDDQGYVTDMIEKPENPPCNLAIGGLYYFKSAYNLFESIKFIIDEEIKTRDEYQLTDAMKNMMRQGEKFKIFNMAEWHDCGEKETLLQTNRVMLEKYATNDKIPGSIINPPVFIGHNTRIENSIIGPYVSISDNSCVKNALITNSILGFETIVENTILDSSLVGDNSFLSEAPKEFNVGPDSEIIFTK